MVSAVMWLVASAKPVATGLVSELFIKVYKDLGKTFEGACGGDLTRAGG